MKFKELKSLNKEELEKKKQELTLNIMKENAQVAIGTTLKNSGQLRTMKKTMAKIHSLEEK